MTPATQVWGIATAPTRGTRVSTVLRGCRAAASLLVVTVTVLLGAAGTVMAATSSANADILGISGSVQDWVCGIVNPAEPWEGVGDGPESWMSNRNLAGAARTDPDPDPDEGSAGHQDRVDDMEGPSVGEDLEDELDADRERTETPVAAGPG